MNDWRSILGFNQHQDLDFSEVHRRYRELMTQHALDAERVLLLSTAIDKAREQLGTGAGRNN